MSTSNHGEAAAAPPPAIVALARNAVWLDADGVVEHVPLPLAAARAATTPVLVCHAPATARRLGIDRLAAFDLLELWAFARPARPVVPTVGGLARALGLSAPAGPEATVAALPKIAVRLLDGLAGEAANPSAIAIARALAAAGWAWGPAATGKAWNEPALAVWRNLPAWQDMAPPDPPGSHPVEPAEARAQLARMLGGGAEERPSQSDYASAVTAAFAPRVAPGEPSVVLAEAGTGTGKTAGYLAAASLWAEKNGAPVWASTYTRALQQQLDTELARLWPDPKERAEAVVIRKGRENYLCLLNLEDTVGRMGTLHTPEAVGIGLVLRWAAATRDGDFGGDFPSWLTELVGGGPTLGLADRRGECIYAACPHYGHCFVERSIRRAPHAKIVVTNHALAMLTAARAGDDDRLPVRYVFDEGHHLFDAADSTFSTHLTAREAAELRRWIVGAEGGRRGRARGLALRAGDLSGGDVAATAALDGALAAARALPGPGWGARILDGRPQGPLEAFLMAVRAQVRARAPNGGDSYGSECETEPVEDSVRAAALSAGAALGDLARPLTALAERLRARLDDEAGDLDSATRGRLDSVARAIERRTTDTLAGWRAMLANLAGGTPPGLVDWFAIERNDGREADVGMYRHHLDPTMPLAAVLMRHAHGWVVTSATLTDATGDTEADWHAAEARTGALHLARPALRARVPSPFDYKEATRILVVRDVRRGAADQVAAAFRELFLASGGGALGLFTAIERLRAVHARIVGPLADAGVPLYAQHVDAMNVSTLLDIFRAEEDSCLLGTDTVRDGVDVPGRSLRLIVFDRVPWPRPTILHKARRAEFGGRAVDDAMARLRLAQAYGRLVRRAGDRGIFVLLDAALPTRLATAFPAGVEIERVGLAEAVGLVRWFFAAPSG
ncbi:MAG: ATP-dependent DNA helicase [Alphaproteobacteria bacterium]|nr:ATP-dependent DNA helicase [Alphaproteobacteria bacterium]